MNERVTRASRVPNFLPPLIKTLSNNSSNGSKSHVSSHEPSTPPTEDSRRHAPTQDLTPSRARRRHKTTTSTPSTRVSRTKRADWISLASNRAIERRKPKSRRVTRRVERAISIAPAGFVCAAATHRATHLFRGRGWNSRVCAPESVAVDAGWTCVEGVRGRVTEGGERRGLAGDKGA